MRNCERCGAANRKTFVVAAIKIAGMGVLNFDAPKELCSKCHDQVETEVYLSVQEAPKE